MRIFDTLRRRGITIAVVAACLPILFASSVGAQYNDRESTVIKDPTNKQNVTGTISLAQIWGQQLNYPLEFSRGLINLKEAVHRWTDIRVNMQRQVYMNSSKFPTMSFAYLTADRSFELVQSEKDNLRLFLDNGGFMVIESATPAVQNNQAENSFKSMLRSTFGSQLKLVPIRNDDALYHCFFDFDDGPPRGAERGRSGSTLNKEISYLEGIYYRGRLAGVLSSKGYIVKWNEAVGGNNTSHEPQLRMGVNFLVYALLNSKSGAPARSR
jgi:hypothetical protein